jgi:hypothetical protein
VKTHPPLPLSMAAIRGRLAERAISRQRFAEACRIARPYLSTILFERKAPGPAALGKLRAGLQALGLLDAQGRERMRPRSGRA